MMMMLAIAGLLLAVPMSASPHIVVVMTDDLDKQSFEIARALHVLPNIESLIVTPGVRFEHAFATNALCAPSRATYLTGKYSHNHRVLTNLPPYGAGAFDESVTVATALRPTYSTAHVGKYLNGCLGDHVPPGWDDWRALFEPTVYRMLNFRVDVNGTAVQYGSTPADFQTSVLGDLAAASVTAGLASGKPLFLTLAPTAPHSSTGVTRPPPCPLTGYAALWCGFTYPGMRDQTAQTDAWSLLANLPIYHALKPSFNEADVSDKPLAIQRPLMTATDLAWFALQYRTRFLSLLKLDDAVGKIALALGSQRSNTVWIFLSDNGWLNGEHRDSQKMAAYEESIRLPLYIAGPGYAPHTATELVAMNDLAPTIREMAGLPPDPLADGRSLVPFLLGQMPAWRRRLLIEHWDMPAIAGIDIPDYAAVRTGPTDAYPDRLYVEYVDGSLELYDLGSDLYQVQSLHADPLRATEIAALHEHLIGLRGCSAATCVNAEN
jgi:N-acetylglucosamine-6-sulfatase